MVNVTTDENVSKAVFLASMSSFTFCKLQALSILSKHSEQQLIFYKLGV